MGGQYEISSKTRLLLSTPIILPGDNRLLTIVGDVPAWLGRAQIPTTETTNDS